MHWTQEQCRKCDGEERRQEEEGFHTTESTAKDEDLVFLHSCNARS